MLPRSHGNDLVEELTRGGRTWRITAAGLYWPKGSYAGHGHDEVVQQLAARPQLPLARTYRGEGAGGHWTVCVRAKRNWWHVDDTFQKSWLLAGYSPDLVAQYAMYELQAPRAVTQEDVACVMSATVDGTSGPARLRQHGMVDILHQLGTLEPRQKRDYVDLATLCEGAAKATKPVPTDPVRILVERELEHQAAGQPHISAATSDRVCVTLLITYRSHRKLSPLYLYWDLLDPCVPSRGAASTLAGLD